MCVDESVVLCGAVLTLEVDVHLGDVLATNGRYQLTHDGREAEGQDERTRGGE